MLISRQNKGGGDFQRRMEHYKRSAAEKLVV